jgi:hypothetical protein
MVSDTFAASTMRSYGSRHVPSVATAITTGIEPNQPHNSRSSFIGLMDAKTPKTIGMMVSTGPPCRISTPRSSISGYEFLPGKPLQEYALPMSEEGNNILSKHRGGFPEAAVIYTNQEALPDTQTNMLIRQPIYREPTWSIETDVGNRMDESGLFTEQRDASRLLATIRMMTSPYNGGGSRSIEMDPMETLPETFSLPDEREYFDSQPRDLSEIKSRESKSSPITSETSEAVQTFFALFGKNLDRSLTSGGGDSTGLELSRQRHRVTPHQLLELEKVFRIDSRPDVVARKRISDRLDMPLKSVSIWFQNRRAKQRNGDVHHRDRAIFSDLMTDPSPFLGSDEWISTDKDTGSATEIADGTRIYRSKSSPIKEPTTKLVTDQSSRLSDNQLSSPPIPRSDEDILLESMSLETMDLVLGEEVLPVDEKMRIWEASNMLVCLRKFVANQDAALGGTGGKPTTTKRPYKRTYRIRSQSKSHRNRSSSIDHHLPLPREIHANERSVKQKSRQKTHYHRTHNNLSGSQMRHYNRKDHPRVVSASV